MSDNSKKITEFPEITEASNTDVLLIVSNTSGNSVTQKIQTINLKRILVINTPANSSSLSVKQGVVFTDSSFLYVATSNNFLKRVSLSAF